MVGFVGLVVVSISAVSLDFGCGSWGLIGFWSLFGVDLSLLWCWRALLGFAAGVLLRFLPGCSGVFLCFGVGCVFSFVLRFSMAIFTMFG